MSTQFNEQLKNMPVYNRPCGACKYIKKNYFEEVDSLESRENQYYYSCEWHKHFKFPLHTSYLTKPIVWITPKQVEGPHEDVMLVCNTFEPK